MTAGVMTGVTVVVEFGALGNNGDIGLVNGSVWFVGSCWLD